MITDSILHALTLMLVAILDVIPVFTAPMDFLGSFAEAVSWIKVLGYYIPIDTIVVCILAYFVVWLVCVVVSAIVQLL